MNCPRTHVHLSHQSHVTQLANEHKLPVKNLSCNFSVKVPIKHLTKLDCKIKHELKVRKYTMCISIITNK